MKRRIKLNNKKSHFPLPLGEGRISTQGTSVRNSGEGKSFTKALSVAALAGLTFFGAQANAQEVNADDNSSLTFEEGQITGAAAEIAPTLGDNSALSFTQENADANNYNFTDTDENGNIRYWLIKLDNDKISNTDHISWEEVDNLQENTIQVNLPNNKSKFYKYTILDTTGDYIGYTNTSSGNARGGAIYNPSNNKIQANFINNSAIATTYAAQGGAIANYNNSSVKEIAGTFIQNGTSAGLNSNGGAIWINDSIVHDKISGAFIGNYNTTTSTQAGSEGGAIAIHGSFVKNIEGNFIGNYQSAQYRDGGGAGLRYYYGSSDSIKSDFIGNHIEVATQAYGGALAVGYSNIKELTGDFVCNSAVGGYSDGGAIIIYGNSGQNAEIKNIKGSFIGNYAIGNSSYAYGGAIRLKNNGNIESLKGNFLGNYAIGKTEAQGGAISNSSATITAINDAVFIGNYALATGANGYAHGGAIYNTGTIGEISKSSFNNNYAKSEKGAAYGGAIYNTGTVNGGTIGEISGNYAEAGANYAYGGAIYNTSSNFKLDAITGDIKNNHATSIVAPAQGGAIYNTGGNLGVITGAIEDNYTEITGTSGGASAQGGAIYNTGTIEKLNATTLKNNHASATLGGNQAHGGAIYNTGTVNGGTIGEISGNYAEAGANYAYGGAIYNTSNTFKLDEIGDITGNHATSTTAPAQGGAIYNTAAADFGKLNGAIKNNYVLSGKLDENGKVISGTGSVAYGGAIYNTAGGFTGGNVTEISGNYAESGSAPAYGGAIYNTSNAFKLDEIGDIINNHVYSPYAPAEGGAIYNEKGNLGEINGAIKDNYAISGTYDENGNLVSGAVAYGGAIYNANNGIVTGGTITEISGNYVEGNAGAYGGAIYNTTNSFKLDEVGDITDNHAIAAVAPAYGGAIYNEKGNLGELNGAIKDNYAVSMRYDSNGEPVGGCGAMGGAIYNINNGTVTGGDITEISGNYVEAYGQGNVVGYYPYARGGAIYNTSSNFKLDSISNITDNHAESTHCAYIDGGAIYNENGNLGEINGVIKNNYLINHDQQTVSDMSGGAIYNYDGTATGGNITEISGNYITSYLAYYSFGGAIYNNSAKFKLDGIANIINNHIEQKREGYLGGRQDGGAIYNSRGNLGTINGVIKDNYIIGSVSYGGAIYNYNGTATGGDITEISGNYIKSYGYAGGGAIYNNSSNFKLDSIGDITNNHIESGNVGSAASGGAIYNSGGNLGVINGVIKNNYVKNETFQALGGAIYNTSGGFTGGVITEISNNYVEGTNDASGGAIYNTSSTFKLDGIGDIINNHAGAINPDYYTTAQGGAIYNSGGNLGEINGVIKNNYVLGNSGGEQGSYAYGGAIYNANNGIVTGGTITEISDNYANAKCSFAYGGAIYNSATFSANIIGDIVNNYIEGKYYTSGGAINNSGTFGNIVSENISNNYAKYENAGAQGGAIDNESNGTIASLYVKNLTDNKIILSDKTKGAYEYGGAIYNAGTINEGFIENVSDNYIDGRQAHGGAIYNTGAFNAAIGNIVNNYAKSTAAPTYGGAIYNSGTMTTLTGDNLSNNYATSETAPVYGGAIYNSGNNAKIDTISYNKIENNYASGKYNAYGGALYNKGTINGGIVNSSFLNNYTEAKDGTAQGGAVWTSKDLDITANNGTSVFKGNYTKTDGEKDDNAIYVASADAKLNLKQLNNGNMYMYDNIRGEDGYNVNISGDSTGTYYMFNDIYNGNVTMANTTINTVNNKIHTYDFKSLSVNGNTDFVADVDMANQTMDRFTASAYGNHSGKLNVKDMNFISGSDKNKIEIYFAQKGLKDYVTTSKKEFLTPLYKYGIHYDNRDDAGYFVFTRGAGSSNPSDGFNPAVLTSPVATQAGAQASMTNTLYYAFEHGDTFMNFSAMDRFAKINSNTYALAERQGALSTDFNSNLNLDYVHQNKAVWTKPYSSFESIHLKNGPKVDVISYGTLIGFDSNIHKLKRGWANVATAYIGYNGSQVDYSNVDASTNGGLLGLTETFYKGNFWTALTATAGASFAEAHTMYGKDEMTMLMAGIGSKTGYNFEFKEGKFIIQPRLFMSYSFVNTFDYTNSAGVRIDSDPMHTVQINPSVKFIGNIKGWQPYASVGMVWNLLNETHTEANGVKLPEMHTKPYVEYGVGLQRTWADKFSAYGQAMLRHGGRNGVALTFGFRWAIGKGVNDKQKVQKDSKMLGRQEVKRASKSPLPHNNTVVERNKKVLKQLSPTQKQKLNKTTRTAIKANVEKL